MNFFITTYNWIDIKAFKSILNQLDFESNRKVLNNTQPYLVVFFSSYLTIKAWFAQSPLNSWCRDESAT